MNDPQLGLMNSRLIYGAAATGVDHSTQNMKKYVYAGSSPFSLVHAI